MTTPRRTVNTTPYTRPTAGRVAFIKGTSELINAKVESGEVDLSAEQIKALHSLIRMAPLHRRAFMGKTADGRLVYTYLYKTLHDAGFDPADFIALHTLACAIDDK